jgi:eukaryotic-like serine/threonine-protein kinase
VAATDPFGLRGHVLDGQFRVDDYVGEGGFSVVYRGTHVGLREPVAVKCLKLPPALGSALVESFIKRFRDESRLHYRLSQGHLHIARCIASGTTVAPATSAMVPYTALEWLDGLSLAEELEERRRRGLAGRPLAEVVRLLDSAIDALAYAHAQGVVHRDLNPGNLFLTKTPSGTKLKVLDFGVAKIMGDTALAMGPGAPTIGNVKIFTPAYGAPEQFDERVGTIGPWTDVYAVALVVLEALTGRTVMEGEHIGELAGMALDPDRRPTPRALGVPIGDEVERALACAVALSPGERPRDAGELWGLLKHAMAEDEARAAATAYRFGLGGTLRMANVPGQRLSQHPGDSDARPLPPPPALPPLPALPPESGDGPPLRIAGAELHATRPTRARAPAFVAVALAILALAALTRMWLLSSRDPAATRAPIVATPR